MSETRSKGLRVTSLMRQYQLEKHYCLSSSHLTWTCSTHSHYIFFVEPLSKVGPYSSECYSPFFTRAADAWRNSLASVFPESAVCLLGKLRPGPLLPGCFRVPRHGCALRSHRGHRGLHRLEGWRWLCVGVCLVREGSGWVRVALRSRESLVNSSWFSSSIMKQRLV